MKICCLRNLVRATSTLIFGLLLFTVIAQDASAVLIKLAWNTPADTTNVTGYRVYHGTTNGGPYPTLGIQVASNTATTTEFNVTTANTYYFVVKSYNGSGESVNSNQVVSTLFNLTPKLEGGASAVGKTFTLQVASPGTATALQVSVTLTADAGGKLPGYSLAGAITNADLRLQTPGHLAKKIANWSITSTADLPLLPAGDINSSNTVDSGDRLIIFNNWFKSGAEITNPLADINGSGTVDSGDRFFLFQNWFDSSDPVLY